ncbi:MAG: hypothetical protein WA738_18180 [Candidatus Angelobacter sp.]
MKIQVGRLWFCACSIIVLAIAGFAQKPDDWGIRNAMIGPDSPIEIRTGSSYDAKAMYPVPDGPLFPLKASVEWSIVPEVKGITIDAKLGKISVSAEVPHGATATIHANVENGLRLLITRVYVFRPEENPFVGQWYVDPLVACGDAQEMKPPVSSHHRVNGAKWKFHVNRQFWIGREMNIAAGVVMSGGYEYDLTARTLKLLPTWPSGKAASSWNYSFKDDEKKKLLLRPLTAEDGLDAGCSSVLHLP